MAEAGPGAAPSPTVGALVRDGIARIAAAGSASARLDAELLLGDALGVGRAGVIAHPESPVGPGAVRAFEAAVERRERGEPVAYIRGLTEFHGLAFSIDDRALIPRPETELLVDAALAAIAEALTNRPRPAGSPPIRVADIGTGSGAIAVSLAVALRKRGMADHVRVIATDRSAAALDLARENVVAHGVADHVVLLEADLVPPHVDPPYQVVAANLPYVATAELERLGPGIAFEPRTALDGGPDGLGVVRELLVRLPEVLAPDGAALLEIGADQEPAVREAVAGACPGWTCELLHDLAGRPRVARLRPGR